MGKELEDMAHLIENYIIVASNPFLKDASSTASPQTVVAGLRKLEASTAEFADSLKSRM